MQKSILWDGINNDTDEHCAVNYLANCIVVRSEIEGWAHGVPVYADYTCKLDLSWNVQEFDINFHLRDTQHSYGFLCDANGKWTDALGKVYPEFEGCRYIDISLSPFTNSLPVNGLNLSDNESAELDLVYIDIINNQIRKERQHYTKLNKSTYRFESNQGAFKADISVDEDGFVTHYPGLFNMIQAK
ncbi:putative glycolipid-binding domain-containing protein [Flavobacterium sp. NRK1]|uniref:putative glycolipid-binding domain-containing protein n=1 Tax=Flavobacterium sp. NRK1 TaxID=2954929 RepID=UPI00209352AD|nr:putative glycolipid-binding domain-containing protein [Flavobacterium sp. NRK1]MCO6148536.1 putative glycolipid-binding domain-containing protein [Flavobacterium sp. NRK1]